MIVCVAGCGRLHFGASGLGGDDGSGAADARDPTADAPPSTGPAGPRYLIEIDPNITGVLVAGANGAVAVAESFQGATTIAGRAMTGQAMYESAALVWLDPAGAPAQTSVLDSTSICHVRELGGGGANGGVISIGYTQSGADTPALGPCALATSHQDGLALAIAPSGVQTPVAHVAASTFNVQGWYGAGLADGTIAVSGIYGGMPKLGGTTFPATTSDENPYVARVDPATGEPRWLAAVVATDSLEAGPVDARDDEVCTTGAFTQAGDVFGTSLPAAVGSHDVWIARIDGAGHARFVTPIGTTADDSTGTSVVATGDGGCAVAMTANADLVIGGMTLPASAGSDVVLRFGATGAPTAGIRAPEGISIGRLGDQIYAALACHGGCTFGGATYTSATDDLVLASLDAALHATVIGAITGGAGALGRFAAIPPDALAVSLTATAPIAFGALRMTPSTSIVNALAVFGVDP